MNSCCFLVKILSLPTQISIDENLSVVKAQVQFPKKRKKKSFDQFQILVWGNLGDNLIEYYTVNDYIIVEGILSIKPNNSLKKQKKDMRLTVKKFYPFLLSGDE